jgi:hypothetical protein
MFVESTMGSPFAVLTAVVAPAMLTNASAVLSLATSNRLARVVDRHRAIAPKLATALDHEAWIIQMQRLEQRAQFLVKALRNIYAALGLFAAATLLSVVGGLGDFYGAERLWRGIAIVALVAGGVAVASLMLSCVYMVRETRLAVVNLAAEAQLAHPDEATS